MRFHDILTDPQRLGNEPFTILRDEHRFAAGVVIPYEKIEEMHSLERQKRALYAAAAYAGFGGWPLEFAMCTGGTLGSQAGTLIEFEEDGARDGAVIFCELELSCPAEHKHETEDGGNN